MYTPCGPQNLTYGVVQILGYIIEFDQLRERRNLLMHFTSSHQSVNLPGIEIQGLADTSVYDNLTVGDARKALGIAEGMVQELLRLRGVQDQQMGDALHHWIGKVPI